MSCTYQEACDIINTIALSGWNKAVASTPNTQIYFDDVDEGNTPSASITNYCRVIIRHNDGFQSSLTGPLEGKKCYTNTGVVTAQVSSKQGQGNSEARELANVIANEFRLARERVWFRNVRINEIGSYGPYVRVNLLCDFTYDEVS